MDKALQEHISIMEFKLKSWEKKGSPDEKRRREMRATYRHHQVKVRDFQHERLVHLLVTLFFGFLCLVSLVALFATVFSGISLLPLLASLLVLVVFITELFYIRHYYLLENGVQKLYTITDRLVVLIG
jgi:hypothetical protein